MYNVSNTLYFSGVCLNEQSSNQTKSVETLPYFISLPDTSETTAKAYIKKLQSYNVKGAFILTASNTTGYDLWINESEESLLCYKIYWDKHKKDFELRNRFNVSLIRDQNIAQLIREAGGYVPFDFLSTLKEMKFFDPTLTSKKIFESLPEIVKFFDDNGLDKKTLSSPFICLCPSVSENQKLGVYHYSYREEKGWYLRALTLDPEDFGDDFAFQLKTDKAINVITGWRTEKQWIHYINSIVYSNLNPTEFFPKIACSYAQFLEKISIIKEKILETILDED